MKAIKILFGVLAVLYVMAHLIEIPMAISHVQGELAISWWLGKLTGILIGSAIALALFKSAFRKTETP